MKAIKKYTQNLDEQFYAYGDKRWRITRLLKLAETLESFELPLKHLNIWYLYPEPNTTLCFVEHVKKVNLADLTYPIILDEEGYVMDGRHRIMKALLENKKSILAVRFDKTPLHCFIVEDKSKK